jgi:helix-turn-helix protein
LTSDELANYARGSKRIDPENMVYDNDGEPDIAASVENEIDNREREPLPHNPPPGPKWQAKQGLARLPLNGAEYSVMACLIDRASKGKGACWPSQDFICGWTSRPERTVKRAISNLKALGLIRVIDRGTISNAYIVNWEPIFAAYRQMKAFEKQHARRRDHVTRHVTRHAQPKVAPQDAAVGPEAASHAGPEVAPKPMKGNLGSKRNLGHINEASADAESYLVLLDEEKLKGIQGRGEVESASTNPQPPAEPNLPNFWEARRRRAIAELETCTDSDRRTQLLATIEKANTYIGG